MGLQSENNWFHQVPIDMIAYIRSTKSIFVTKFQVIPTYSQGEFCFALYMRCYTFFFGGGRYLSINLVLFEFQPFEALQLEKLLLLVEIQIW